MERGDAGRLGKNLAGAWSFLTDIVVTKAEGLYVYGDDGRRYMDFTSGHAVCNVGHNHPAVVAAIRDQAGRLVHAGSIFHFDALYELVERLGGIAPPGTDRVFMSNSGSEAVEGAIKLARYHTRRQGVISFSGAFHGRTLGSVSITSSSSKYRARYHPLVPSVYRAFYPYCYRCVLGLDRKSCGVDCLKFIDNIFATEITPEEVAAIIIEPVLGEGGYVPAPPEFLKELREICDRHGILLIFDEVQSGMGRTCRWLALEHSGVVPDIVTLAKGIAAGMPLSAVVSTPAIMDGWEPGAHGTTFGGNPVSCAAACAMIDAVRAEGLLESSAALSAHALERLGALGKECPVIGDVRGLGYMIGVEFVKDGSLPYPEAVARLKSACLSRGLIIMGCGTYKNTVRFIPPLVTTAAQMDEALGIFEECARGL